MRKSTNETKVASKNYWENENPIVTETDFAQIRYYKNAGKIQLYPTYTDRDGVLQVGRGCTWDNNDMDSDDALALAFGVMQGLLDVGVENDAFADAYAILEEAIGATDKDTNSKKQTKQSDEDGLDEEFEDEEEFDLSTLDRDTLKKVAREFDIKVLKKDTVETLVEKIEENDAEDILQALIDLDIISDEEDEETEEVSNSFVGKKLVYNNGKYAKATQKVKDDYISWAEDSQEWVEYITSQADELSAMPTKTPKQRKAQDKVYAVVKSNIQDWIDSWADEDCVSEQVVEEVTNICKEMLLHTMDADKALCKLVGIIDGLKL